MVSWIQDFVNTYHARTGRYPMIYTNPDWWTTCTGNSHTFSTTCPLVLARWASTPGTIPGGWPFQTIWQNSDKYTYGGDSDIFNGDMTRLKVLATGWIEMGRHRVLLLFIFIYFVDINPVYSLNLHISQWSFLSHLVPSLLYWVTALLFYLQPRRGKFCLAKLLWRMCF